MGWTDNVNYIGLIVLHGEGYLSLWISSRSLRCLSASLLFLSIRKYSLLPRERANAEEQFLQLPRDFIGAKPSHAVLSLRSAESVVIVSISIFPCHKFTGIRNKVFEH